MADFELLGVGCWVLGVIEEWDAEGRQLHHADGVEMIVGIARDDVAEWGGELVDG